MAHANNSIITGKFRGLLGKQIVFRDWAGKTVVAKAPRARTGEPTAAQLVMQENFLMATRYAKAIISSADKSMAEAYALALKPRQNIYSRATEDFLSLPIVKSINPLAYAGAAGNTILARAVDDFRVTAVRVEIYAAAGSLLEAGNAVQNSNGLDWTYTVTQVNNQLTGTRLKVIATDLPGNTGSLEMVI